LNRSLNDYAARGDRWAQHLPYKKMIKKLIVINGTMGIGKIAVANSLKNQLQNSVMLDGESLVNY